VRKTTRFAGADESVSEALLIADDERALAEQVLDGRSEGLLYARVDVMRDDGGNACISELEIIEPSLFLAQCRPALDRLVSAIVRHARLAS
jgi:hypothetical protein